MTEKPTETTTPQPPVTESTESSREAKKPARGFQYRLTRFVFVCLYICFLTAMVIGLLAGIEYYAYLQIKKSPMGKAYEGRSLDLARQSSQKVAPQYGYEPTPGFAATRNTHLGNAYEYINAESFKDFEDVPMEKPADEYRIIMTGGSVVYGRGPVPPTDRLVDFYEVTYRWTIPHIMQELLNADPAVREKIGNKRVRVINAGVPGHVIQNDLMRYLAKLRLYKPDMVISLDGVNDNHTVAKNVKDWNYFTEGPYYDIITEVMDMGPKGLANYLTLWLKRNTYFFAWLAMRKGEGTGTLDENRGISAHIQDATPEMLEFRNRNIRQVADVEAIFHKVLETDGVPHILAIQPLFRTCKKKRTPIEKKIEAETGMVKVGFFDTADTYNELVKQIKARLAKENYEVLDLTTIFTPVTEWVWTDWCHLTNGANYIIAKALTYEAKKKIFGLPVSPKGPFDGPLDTYFADYAKDARVYVNGKLTDRGLHILKGYPGKEVLDVPAASKTDPGAVMLDFGAVMPVSRLRVVWGSKESVPREWAIQLSKDGKEWTTWAKFSDIKPDPYDQWPGFEYYAPVETSAQFARYVQLGPDAEKEIQLRQVSLFR